MEVKGAWEDRIFIVKLFIDQLQKTQNRHYKKLVRKLKKDGMPKDMEEYLFDYIFNGVSTSFEEYLDIYSVFK